MSLSNKCFSNKMSLKCVLNERVFNNDIVLDDSVLNFSYSFFADSLTFRAALVYFSIKYNSLMLVILLNATYICPWLKDFWDSKTKIATPSVKLRPCTLWTVQAKTVLKESMFFRQMVVAYSYEDQTMLNPSLSVDSDITQLLDLTSLPLTCTVIIKLNINNTKNNTLNWVTLPSRPLISMSLMSMFDVIITCKPTLRFNWLSRFPVYVIFLNLIASIWLSDTLIFFGNLSIASITEF